MQARLQKRALPSEKKEFLKKISKFNEELKELDSAFNDQIFHYLDVRQHSANATNEVLTRKIDEHYSALANFSSSIKLAEPEFNKVDDVRELVNKYRSINNGYEKVSRENAQNKSNLDASEAELKQRAEMIKKMFRN